MFSSLGGFRSMVANAIDREVNFGFNFLVNTVVDVMETAAHAIVDVSNLAIEHFRAVAAEPQTQVTTPVLHQGMQGVGHVITNVNNLAIEHFRAEDGA